MKFLTFACIVLIVLIAVAFAFYARLTNEVIKGQEREIAALKRERGAYQKYIERLSRRKIVKVENITVKADELDNLPDYPSRSGF